MKISKEKKIFLLSISTLLLASLSFVLSIGYITHLKVLRVTPYDVVVSDVQPNSVIVSWKTMQDTPSYIKLGKNNRLIGDESLTRIHRVKVVDLKDDTRYSFSISDGKRDWEKNEMDESTDLSNFALKEYLFKTSKTIENISLPNVEELHVLPNELIYVTLYNQVERRYSEIKSYYANIYGGVAVDLNSFNVDWSREDIEIYNINYFSAYTPHSSKRTVHASEINCNQNIPDQTISGVSKDEFVDLATRWTAGRGKNYAEECFNDVVYRSKMAELILRLHL